MLEAAPFALTGVVPASVPSLFHSLLRVPSAAVKNNVPLTLVRPVGPELLGSVWMPPFASRYVYVPGWMSLTIVVPAAVPSLFHNSRPSMLLVALKYSVPLTFVRPAGFEPTVAEPRGTMTEPDV